MTAGDLVSRVLAARISNPFRRSGGYVVLDIGSSCIKLAEVQHGSGGPRLTAIGMASLPPDVIQSNVIQDEAAVAEAIRSLVQQTGVKTKQAITAVPGPAVMVKKVVLPTQTGAAIETAVLAEASHLIPDSLDNVCLDFQVIDSIEDGAKMEVLVVAVKKDIINRYTDVLRAADLEPVLVDVDYFALENMFEHNYDAPEGRPVALVNIGARFSSINILKDGRSTFTGDVPVGGAEYADALVRQLGCSPQQAESLKLGGTIAGIDANSSQGVVGSVTEFICDEIQRALTFFWTAATDESLGGVFLCGGTARMPDLTEQLKVRLDCPVEIVDPFRRMTTSASVDRGLIDEAGPALAVAVGLATRRPGDK